VRLETKIRVIIVVIATACCAIPLLLFSVGLGSLSIGAFTEKYSMYFIIAGIIILALALYFYFRGRKRCKDGVCEIETKEG